MKNIIPIVSLAVLLCAGCSTVAPYLTPAALTSEVSQGIQVGLEAYPAAAPDVALARDVICAESTKGVTDPAVLVADLQAIGFTNAYTKIIVNGALLIYDAVYVSIGTNSAAAMQPYVDALCAGFTAGLPPVSPAVLARGTKKLPPHIR